MTHLAGARRLQIYICICIYILYINIYFVNNESNKKENNAIKPLRAFERLKEILPQMTWHVPFIPTKFRVSSVNTASSHVYIIRNVQ
jgi:hypothetical protein